MAQQFRLAKYYNLPRLLSVTKKIPNHRKRGCDFQLGCTNNMYNVYNFIEPTLESSLVQCGACSLKAVSVCSQPH